MRGLNWKLVGLLIPFGFVTGVLITFLPPKPRNVIYVREHPTSVTERAVVGLIGALFFPMIVAAGFTKKL